MAAHLMRAATSALLIIIQIPACLMVAGCAHRSAPSANPELQREVNQLAIEVARFRGLPMKRSIIVRQLSGDEFRARLFANVGREIEREVQRIFAALSAFMGPGRGERSEEDVALEQLLDTQIAGFYDFHSDELVIRPEDEWNTEGNEVLSRLILVHEIVHALQAQSFGFDSLSGEMEPDCFRARSALFEGDAQLTAILFTFRDNPQEAKLAEMARVFRLMRVTDSPMGPFRDIELSGAHALLRDAVIFPYMEGTAFAVDLYRVGGFGAIDAAYGSPPGSSSEIMDPRRYASGSHGFELSPAEAPPGAEIVHTGSLGALWARSLLRELQAADPGRTADALLGDAYVAFAARGATELSIVWTTLWAADAAEHEWALDVLSAAWPDGAFRRIAPDPRSSPGAPMVLMAARGPDAERVLQHAAGAGPPRATRIIRKGKHPSAQALAALPEDRRGGVFGSTFRSDWLALEVRIPEGMQASIPDDGPFQLRLSDRSRGLNAWLAWYPTRTDIEKYLDRFATELVERQKGSLAEAEITSESISTEPFGAGRGRAVAIKDRGRARVLAWPSCGGDALFVLTGEWKNAADDEAFERIVDGLWRSARLPRGCAVAPAPPKQ